MRLLVLGVAGMLVLFPAVVYWFDVVFNNCSKLKRYHIGRWSDPKQWERAVAKKACSWMKHTPTVKLSDSSRYILIDFFKGRYRSATIQSWQIAGLAMGICDYLKEARFDFFTDKLINRFITGNGDWRCEVNRVDYAMLAYVILKNASDPMKVFPAMKKMVSVIEANVCSDGMISYSQGSKSIFRYVDTLGMVCPFLALYGNTYGCPEYTDLSIRQIECFREKGMFPDTQLPCHAYNVENGLPVGIYGWGRGTAWYCLGLLDTWNELQKCEKSERLKAMLYEAAENYMVYQQEDGGFHTILQGGGQYDSSVTATMAFFYCSCAHIFGDKRYQEIYEKCISKLMTMTMKSGAIDGCQGDTHGLGAFSQVYDVMPFAQGLVLRALAINAGDVMNEAIY